MSKTVGWIVLVLGSILVAGEPGIPAQYAGGTVPGLPSNSGARVDVTGPDALLFHCGGKMLRVPYYRINSLEYGQTVNRRFLEAILISPVLLLSKSRKHFVTVGFKDQDDRQQALVFRVGKGEIRTFLASLEARSGRKVEFTDDEARKSGKG